MSAHHVLGVLEGEGLRARETFDCAVALADREHARLTLTATTDPGRFTRWLTPNALQTMLISPGDVDFVSIAGHALSRMAEFVPAEIPLTTLVLGQDTTASLIQLLRHGPYDTMVSSGKLQRRRRVRRELTRLQLRAVVAPHRRPSPQATARARPEIDQPA